MTIRADAISKNESEPHAPDALHVGFSKCASTFLQAFFAEHSAVFMVNQSHYLAPFVLSSYPDGRGEYLRLFREAGDDQVRIESDEHIVLPIFHPVLKAAATTLESIVEVSRRIKAVQPTAKVIVVIRNQVDLLVSRYSEYILCGGKCEFDEFVAEFLHCSVDGKNYYQNYYSKILDILYTELSPERVLMLLQEDLSRDEEATIQALSDFLGVDARRPTQRGMISRRIGLSSLGIRVMRTINKALVREQKQSFKEAKVRVPFILYKIIQRGVRIIDYYLPKGLKRDKNDILTEAVKTRICDEFGNDNARLGEMLNKDLTKLGYHVPASTEISS